MHVALSLFFFFFQAEDGIRDTSVTGVQTCALPISGVVVPARTGVVQAVVADRHVVEVVGVPGRILADGVEARSEERRVGKECRSWWWPYHEKKKSSSTEYADAETKLQQERLDACVG